VAILYKWRDDEWGTKIRKIETKGKSKRVTLAKNLFRLAIVAEAKIMRSTIYIPSE